MKKKFLFLLYISVIFSSFVFGQTKQEIVTLSEKENDFKVLTSTDNGLTVEVNIGNFYKTPISINDQKYYAISLLEESLIKEKGNPELPKIVKSITIPNATDITANIISSEYVDLDLSIIPSKGLILRTQNPDSIPYSFSSIYSNNEFFPKETIRFSEPYLMRNVRGTAVSICPFAYNPITKKLRVFTKLNISISFVGTNLKNSLEKPSSSRNSLFDTIYKKHFINYKASKLKSINLERSKILVIAPNAEFLNEMTPFMSHKYDRGLDYYGTTMQNINVGSTSTSIYNFIKKEYEKDRTLTYVLLVGDNEQVPTIMLNGSGSDASYSLVDGDDSYPDLIVGRFSAETKEQVRTMVQRSIEYENMTEQPWFHHGFYLSDAGGAGDGHNGGESDGIHAYKIQQRLLKYHYTKVDLVWNAKSDPLAPEPWKLMDDAMEEGVSIINYSGHGNVDGWVGYMGSAGSPKKLPFIFSVACSVGDFTGKTCFAENWLRRSMDYYGKQVPLGAIAFYGSSWPQAWDVPMEAQDEFNSLLTSNAFLSFGALCYHASCKMMDVYGQKGVNEFLHWNIFGDPSLFVIPHVPRTQCLSKWLTGTITNNCTNCKITVSSANIPSGTNIVLDHEESTTIYANFEMQLGSTLEIK